MRVGRLIPAVFAAAAFAALSFGSGTGWAQEEAVGGPPHFPPHPPQRSFFTPLSFGHTQIGVSQFNYGGLTSAPRPIKLLNPGPVSQVAGVLIYTLSEDPEETEIFEGCEVRKVTSHGAVAVSSENFDGPQYAEVIWAPTRPVRIFGFDPRHGRVSTLARRADGLGGNALGGSDGNLGIFYLGHPFLFSLPSNRVVPYQRQAAVKCLCEGLEEISDHLIDAFTDFGVHCRRHGPPPGPPHGPPGPPPGGQD